MFTCNLQRQHLVCVEAAAQVSGAVVTGAAVGSSEITFAPDGAGIRAGSYTFDIGSAGSTTLVLQTVLPMLLHAKGHSDVSITGGTHNPMAPPSDFLIETFLPVLQRMGARVSMECPRYGFYPAGGGKITAHIEPLAAAAHVQILERGEARQPRASAIVANLKPDIARRELDVIRAALKLPSDACRTVVAKDVAGAGNAVVVVLPFVHISETVVSVGERGVRAEDVAGGVADEVAHYLSTPAPVGEHLADQLLLPLAIGAGGSFVMSGNPRSQHFITNAALLHAFTAGSCVRWQVQPSAGRRSAETWLVEVTRAKFE